VEKRHVRAVAAVELPVDYVDSAAGLSRVCEHLATVERFALDTEFVGERSYFPKLEMVQVATDERVALIDCSAVSDLGPLFAILADEKIEKILHAAQQDLDLFKSLAGAFPRPVIDTQMASAMAGYGAQVGYAQLLERLLGVALEKTETLSDWSRRPLSKAQLEYAADDVRYLLPLHDELRARLVELERWQWLVEECRLLEESSRGLEVDPREAYLRVRGRGSLRPRGLAVLRELAAWREELARERDKPRFSVARDEALVEIARRAPGDAAALRGMRALRSRELERRADEIVAQVERALALPKSEWPAAPPAQGPAPAPGVVEILQAVLRRRAAEASMAPTLLATQADLQELAQRHAAGSALEDLAVLVGWRRAMVGEDLLRLLRGEAAVAVDANSGELRLVETQAMR